MHLAMALEAVNFTVHYIVHLNIKPIYLHDNLLSIR